MQINVNGEPRTLPAEATLAVLVTELGLDGKTIAVERNREIVPRATYSETPLTDGDQIEIVTIVGGG